MKKYLVFLLLLIPSKNVAHGKNATVTKMVVYRVSFSIESVSNVSCDAFINAFTGQIDTLYINNIDVQNKVLMYLKSAAPLPKYSGPDTRAKLIISYKSGKSDIYCLVPLRYFQRTAG
jgi:hypothetical protein